MPFLQTAYGLMRVPYVALPRDESLEADERQWQALEARGHDAYLTGCRPTFANTPHPRSAYAYLSMRSPFAKCHGSKIPRGLLTLTKAEQATVAGRELVYR